jgi:isopenicillin N synthase-like dioxygenase
MFILSLILDTPYNNVALINSIVLLVILCISNIVEDYNKEMRKIVAGLAKAVSKNLGFDENYIENAFNMNSGFDVMAMNLYPPNSKAKGAIGLPNHTDPGFVVTLMQDVNGGLQILSHKGKWINVYIPHNAILIQLGDHLEVLFINIY